MDSIDIIDGQIIFVKDQRFVCLDIQGERTEYRQIIVLKTEAQRTALSHPIQGFYFVIETVVLWNYTTGVWTPLNSPPEEQIIFSTLQEFPEVGEDKKLYVDGKVIYRWIDGHYETMQGAAATIQWKEV